MISPRTSKKARKKLQFLKPLEKFRSSRDWEIKNSDLGKLHRGEFKICSQFYPRLILIWRVSQKWESGFGPDNGSSLIDRETRTVFSDVWS